MITGADGDEVRLLRAHGVLLRERIDGLTQENIGQATQIRALGQEIDIYRDALEKLFKKVRSLELQITAHVEKLADKDAVIMQLTTQLMALRERQG